MTPPPNIEISPKVRNDDPLPNMDQTNQIYINSVGVISYPSFGLLGEIVECNLEFVVGHHSKDTFFDRGMDEVPITVYREDS
ncbi:hypothetical protein K435DRAFT_784219 [Dendrothele bispora CBS 962.96]|uniref:Uncharacterized protein n=1 Tax=Dendrothele bispora (strain CBS 962.96) TaxID=1314807 RepID=A0A4S8L489_DENBC|nr:hypothetical protein K435DRAFT_784219 [Dendrothele bispora CBS 962.96]